MSASAKLRALRSMVDAFDDAIVSGPGLSLSRAIKRELSAGNATAAEGILKRAALNGRFDGDLNAEELKRLRSITDDIDKKLAMPFKEYAALAKSSTKEPLFLDETNFPAEMSRRGFVPLTGVNINNPKGGNPNLTIRGFTGDVRERFIDEGAQNLIAAWNLDPAAARRYSRFYPRVRDKLEATGIPMDRVGGAWATMSSRAEPGRNAELLGQVLRDPTAVATTSENQLLALRFLAGLVDDPAQALGMGKRFNFMHNSIDPLNPAYLTGDTRYAQNVQGVLTAYDRAAFPGMFTPHQPQRYMDIYSQPGFEAALRLGVSPSALQGGTWGNWRNIMAGIPDDIPPNLLDDLANFNYNPDVYNKALRKLGGIP